MSLAPGTRLGPYEILAPLGAGGMGEVYRARDTRLGRDVAIKVLPRALASDPAFRERFGREAKSISALSHPHICTLHDIGRQDGVDFLVMELLEGETLAARIEKGPLPLADSLRIAMQIAGALDKAHRQGIVHRDLKPGNVMLTKSGAKLLDFGLAKVAPAVVGSGATTMAVGTGAPITERGTILGTFQYMAPEQIEGIDADARADIFAFGAVLFEMLTGRKAFSGGSPASLMGAILKDEPPLVSQLQPITPAALDHVVRTCLAKDRDERFQTAHDVLLQLRWIAESGSAAGLPAPVAAHRKRRDRALIIALGTLALIWLVTLIPAAMFFRAVPAQSPIRFTVPVPVAQIGRDMPSAAVSPDGRLLAYSGTREPGGPVVLWLRPLDALAASQIPGTEGATQPFWSPDSRHLGFVAEGSLKRVAIDGGAPQTLGKTVAFGGGAWSGGDVILFSSGGTITSGALFTLPAAGGEPVALARPDRSKKQTVFRWPVFLPDGRRYLVLVWSDDPDARGIYAGSLDGPEMTLVVKAESMPVYTADGFLLYHRGGTLLAHRFDAATQRVSGDPFTVAEDVRFNPSNGRAVFSASNTGVLAFRSGSQSDLVSDLTWFDRSGRALEQVGDTEAYYQLRLSPDQQRVAVTFADRRTSHVVLWTIDLRTNISSPLSAESGANDPVWSPDSTTVMFEATPHTTRDFFSRALGGAAARTEFESEDDPKWLDDWSPDGRFALFHLPQPSKLYYLSLDNAAPAARKPVLLTESSASIDGAHFSPDGKWIAYASTESGAYEVWVASFPAFDKRRRVSARGGGQPIWRGDGRELFYLAPEGRLMSAAVAMDARTGLLDVAAPVVLFQSPLPAPALTVDQYAAARDGRRFLFIQPKRGETSVADSATVIVNWHAQGGK